MKIKDQLVESFLKKSLAIDTESTGLDAKLAEICEVGSAGTLNGKKCASRSELFGTFEGIPFPASAKNNISRNMLKNLAPFKENLDAAVDILALKDPTIEYYIAHNYEYDRTILQSHFERIGRKDLIEALASKKWICTYRLAQHLFKPTEEDKDFSYSLNYLRYAFNLPCDSLTVHRAGDDSEVCWYLMQYIAYYILDNLLDAETLEEDFDLADFLYQFSKEPIEFTVMPFGKHKGKSLKEVPGDYYNWLINNADSLNEKSDNYDPDFASSVEKELNRRLGN